MRILLDTHIWIWYVLGDSALRAGHRHLIEDPEVDIWLSAISIWEAHLLIERKRLPVTRPAADWIRQALQLMPVHEAPVSFRIAALARSIELPHGNPADRFIAATAQR